MSDQAIPESPIAIPGTYRLPTEWQHFIKELLRRVAELESRVQELEDAP